MTVNSSRIIKFAAPAYVIFFSPLPFRSSTRMPHFSLSSGFYIYYLVRACSGQTTITDKNENDRGAKIHPSGSPQFLPPDPFFSPSPPPENVATRVLHPPPLAGKVATDASAFSALSRSPSLSRSHAPTFFLFRARRYSPEMSRKRAPLAVRLTRVLFDYYFGTYRALVTSLCGHMVVGG